MNSTAKPLRIGVSGHRFLAELERLRGGVDTALSRIADYFPGRPFRVLSSLAEGADRLVAGRILERPGAKLIAILPLPKDLYVDDFATPESKADFRDFLSRAAEIVELPANESRDESYEASGEYILGHCDVLFAIWDGRTAQGRGGTGAIVERARERGTPLVWVHAGNRIPGGTAPTSLGEEQGAITFERIPGGAGPGERTRSAG